MRQISVLTPRAPIPFSYCIDDSASTIPLGSFVRVNLRNRDLVGVVWEQESEQNSLPKPLKNLKTATHLHHLPALSTSTINYIKRAANYTLSDLGQILRLIIPSAKLTENISSSRRTHLLPSLITSEDIIKINPQNASLTDKQQQIVDKILVLSSAKDAYSSFSASLLQGVTGSGKTETYFSLIKDTIKRQKQAIILLPEIILSEQIFLRAKQFFQIEPAIWHSDLSPAKRKYIWQKWLSGEIPLLIGTRSALHLPCKNLEIIVVDEEHDTGFKQEEGGAIYNARDLAVLKAQCENIPVILCSATPSFETIYNVEQKKYHSFFIEKRYGQASMPTIKICNMKDKNICPPKYTLSEPLKESIIKNFHEKRQSLIFINRRGYSPVVICQNCLCPLECRHDKNVLAYHLKTDNNLSKDSSGIFFTPSHKPSQSEEQKQLPENTKLLCHLCGSYQQIPKVCPHCQKKSDFHPRGWGVERIAEEISNFTPNAKIAIATSDTLNSKANLKSFLNSMTEQKIDIVVGTQLIAKGLHFPRLSLVGIIDVHQACNKIDFRGNERCFQITHQVSGRSGRTPHIKGLVIIQTYDNLSPLIKALKNINDNEAQKKFILNEMKERQKYNLPPYSFYASLILSSKNLQTLKNTCYSLHKLAPKHKDFNVFPPIKAQIAFVKGQHRYRFLIKSNRPHHPQNFIKKWLKKMAIPNNVKINIDIDPLSFF